MSRIATAAAVLLILFGVLASVRAQWVQNGAAICIQPYEQSFPEICSDGAGGAIMTWNDYRTPEPPYLKADVYAQRIDAWGNVLWTANGAPVCLANDDQGVPQIVSDGAGGAILIWTDQRNAATKGSDIYAQRINSAGTTLWTTNGIAVCDTTQTQMNPRAVSDGRGGAIVVWEDYRVGSESDIYVQRIKADGSLGWTRQGVVLCNATQWQTGPQIVADVEHGAIVVWVDTRSATNYDIYAQRVDSTGTRKWAANGIGIAWESSDQVQAVAAPDGVGGAVIAWTDMRNGNADIFGQWIDIGGSPRWTAGGAAVCAAASQQNYPVVLGNGLLGAYVMWMDQRNSAGTELYAQYMRPYGSSGYWTADGIKIVDEFGVETVWDACTDGAGGMIVSWGDNRTGSSDMYVQRVDRDGNALWTTNGVAVCDAAGQQTRPQLLSDGQSGCFVMWADYRVSANNYDIYAQRIERNGYWGFPSPVIAGVEDVPADQGGLVTVRWDASRLDNYIDADVTHYSIWRSLTAPEVAAMTAAGAPVADIEDVGADFTGPAIRKVLLGGAAAYWEWVGNMDAHFLQHYAYTAATRNDSIPGNPGMEYFFVSAHTADPTVFWDSPPDSGYSTDDLAPCAPAALSGEQSAAPAGLDLSWAPNAEFDLSHYCVYRGSSSDFIPDPGNRIACVADTTAFDGEWRWDSGFCYKVSAVDIHGNESLFAVLTPDDVTGVEDTGTPSASFLAQNYPNPFNPETAIRFGLSESAVVSLRVYDAAGRVVRELLSEARAPGYYRETWDGRTDNGAGAASGVYFYVLDAGRFRDVRKMVLLR